MKKNTKNLRQVLRTKKILVIPAAAVSVVTAFILGLFLTNSLAAPTPAVNWTTNGPSANQWILLTRNGEVIQDRESRAGCTDPTANVPGVSPTEVDIASQAKCSGSATSKYNPGKIDTQFGNGQQPSSTDQNTYSGAIYFKDINGDSAVCNNISDDYLFFRMRLAGRPSDAGFTDLTANDWFATFDINNDGNVDFYVVIDGSGQNTVENIKVVHEEDGTVNLIGAGDYVSATYSNPLSGSPTSNRVRVGLTTPDNGTVGDATEYFLDFQIPFTDFRSSTGTQIMCEGNAVKLVNYSTAASNTDPFQKDKMADGSSDPISFANPKYKIEKTATDVNNSPLIIGDQVEYSIKVTNLASTLNNLTITDTIPAGATFVTGSYNTGKGIQATFNTTSPSTYALTTASDTPDTGAPTCASAATRCNVKANFSGNTVTFTNPFIYAAGSANATLYDTVTIKYRVTYATANTYDNQASGTTTQLSTALLSTCITGGAGTCPSGSGNLGKTRVTVLAHVDTSDLSITKTDGATDQTPGAQIIYTIVVTNNGPDAVTGATVTDTFPAALSGVSWTCSASSGSSCPAGGTGNISSSVNLLNGGTATYTVTATISSGATGTLSNTATAAVPSGVVDGNTGNNSATDTDTLTNRADLSLTKTDNATQQVPGTQVTYTIVATNNGPNAVTGATVTDTFASSLSSVSWTCTASSGSSCTASGTGNLSDSVSLLNSGTASYSVTATISSGATGTLVNTATVTGPTGVIDDNAGNNTDTDTDDLTLQADLSITKTDGASEKTPGTPVTYTIVVTNNGPSDVTGASVADTIPGALSNAAWTCVASSGSSCTASGTGDINATVNLESGDKATFTVNADINPGAIGTLENTSTVTAPDGVYDSNLDNNTATDSDNLTPTGDLSITKTDNADKHIPGTQITYTIVAANSGPSDISGASVTDTFPGSLLNVTWTCAPSPGSICTAGGTGNINDPVNLLSGGTATYTVVADTDAGATGTLVNTAEITVPEGTTDGNSGNNSATDTDSLAPSTDLAITKIGDTDPIVAGNNLTYTITVTNNGPSDATGVTVKDNLPAGVTFVDATPTQGSCSQSLGVISCNLGAMPDGTFENIMVVVTVPSSVQAGSDLTNTASVKGNETDPDDSNNSGTESTVVTKVTTIADLSITKTDSPDPVSAGQNVTWTIHVTNDGPSDAQNVVVTDMLPGQTPFVSATPDQGSCSEDTGFVTCNLGTVPAGSNVKITIVATPMTDGHTSGNVNITNNVSVTSETSDPEELNNSAEDSTTVKAVADLGISKTDNSAEEVPGTQVTYTIVVTNDGPSAVSGASVKDTFAEELSNVTWTCAASSGSSCTSSGSGDINDSVNLWSGGIATYTITADIDSSATGTLENTANVTAPQNTADNNGDNDTSTDTDTLTPTGDLEISKTDFAEQQVPGTQIEYKIFVKNNGPSDIPWATVTDSFPGNLSNIDWTCGATTGSSCTANGGGNINDTVNLRNGGTATYTVTADIAPGATGTLENTATVTPPENVIDTNSINNTSTDTDELTPMGDLSITKTDDAGEHIPGTPITYTVVATNSGPSDIIGATVTDSVPLAMSNVTWTCAASSGSSCTASGSGNLNDTVDLLAGGTATYTVTADVDPGATGKLENTAVITQPKGSGDDNNDNNSSTDTDDLTPRTDLAITKIGDTDPVVAGNDLIYTITVTNNGPSDATGVTVADDLPSGVTFVSADPTQGSCSENAGVITCDLGTMPNGTYENITVKVNVPSDTDKGARLTNQANVTGNETDPDTSNNSGRASTVVTEVTTEADLSITKSDSPDPVIAGENLTYTLKVKNDGPSSAQNVVVTDMLPSDTSYVSYTSSKGTCSEDTGIVTCELGTVAKGATVTITIVVTPMTDGRTLGDIEITNRADVTSDTSETNSEDNSASATTTVKPSSDLSISKTASPDPVVAGEHLTYTLLVSNNGPSSNGEVTVTDALPAGTTYVGFTADQGSCSENSGTVSCNLGKMDNGDSLYVTIEVAIPINTPGDTALENTATVNVCPPDIECGITDPNTENNTSTISSSTSSRPSADLSITKTGAPDPVVAGFQLTYTLTVTNDGPAAATNVIVTDTLPTGTDLANDPTPDQGSCTNTDGTITCELGTINNGGSVTIEVVVIVSSTVPNLTIIENTADVHVKNDCAPDSDIKTDAPCDPIDNNSENNSYTSNTNVTVGGSGTGGGGGTGGGEAPPVITTVAPPAEVVKPVEEHKYCLGYNPDRPLTFLDVDQSKLLTPFPVPDANLTDLEKSLNVIKDTYIANILLETQATQVSDIFSFLGKQWVISGYPSRDARGVPVTQGSTAFIGPFADTTRLELAKVLLISHCYPILNATELTTRYNSDEQIHVWDDLPNVELGNPVSNYARDVAYSAQYWWVWDGFWNADTQRFDKAGINDLVTHAQTIKMNDRLGQLVRGETDFTRDAADGLWWKTYYAHANMELSNIITPELLAPWRADEVIKRGEGIYNVLKVMIARNLYSPADLELINKYMSSRTL